MEDMKKTAEMQSSCGCGGCGPDAVRHEVESAQNAAESTVQSQSETQVEKVEQDSGATYMPAVDIIDGESEALLLLDIPGVAEGDVDLTLEKNVLTIKASLKDEQSFEGKEVIYSEYGVGDYRRTFTLTEDIDSDGITASMKDGVLKVRLPKRAPVTKKISVGATA